MKIFSTLTAGALTAGLLAALSAPAFGQAGTPPKTVPVPNSSNVVKCDANGNPIASSTVNSETEASNPVPGTPVTQTSPSGSGTTSTQTPMLQKGPPPAASMNCPKPAQPANSQMMSAPTPVMNAMTSNPNGPRWLDKYNRTVARTTHKIKRP